MEDTLPALIPAPKRITTRHGTCLVDREIELLVTIDDARIARASGRWRGRLRGPKGTRAIAFRVEIDATRQSSTGRSDGYLLTVAPDGIRLVGSTPAGCFHGLQTLEQLTDFDTNTVACCEIEDAPDFATRGLLHDVTRGKVPTLATLQELVDRLALLKINQLQIYIEHAFVFSFDGDICGPDDGLTPDEVRALDAYCRERFIELVPAVATFGHMGRILSMPKYRHLAEIEATQTWSAMPWPDRARGFTLDCMNPESHRLVEHIWEDVLAAFSSDVVNVCGDEPHDLGLGKNRERCPDGDFGKLYVDQMRRVISLCSRAGRRVQAWSDIMTTLPHLHDSLPKDLTVLHWGYDEETNYDGSLAFADHGLTTMVCPGVVGWKRVINAIGSAERNITKFAIAGLKHGATGLLNTDWGDHGHFNALACSWHGIALGAALAWSADHPTGETFDYAFARVVLGQRNATGVRLLRKASRIADQFETWRLLWQPLDVVRNESALPTRDEGDDALANARAFEEWCASQENTARMNPDDANELLVAARFAVLAAERMGLALKGANDDRRSQSARVAREEWAKRIAAASDEYASCWRARNKPSGLRDIQLALTAAARDMIHAKSGASLPCR